MTILATSAIYYALRNEDIICNPFPKGIQGSHIDVHIGRYYWVLKQNAHILDPQNDDPLDWYILKDTEGGSMLLPPNSFILSHTEEFIGDARGKYVPMLETRSTLARWAGVSIHASAGMGDPYYHSRWTLEIRNSNPFAIVLPPRTRGGGVCFHKVEGAAALYIQRYNAMEEEWTPYDMLPRKGNLQ